MPERTGRPSLTLVRGDGGRNTPRDALGRPLPIRPRRGLRVEVAWADHAACFDRWTIVRATREAFTARCGRRSETLANPAWDTWLRARCTEGRVTVHHPGCDVTSCRGCPPERPDPTRLRALPNPVERAASGPRDDVRSRR